MSKLTKAPTVNPVKPLPTAKAPPQVPKTKDDYTHHTSPVKGPQPVAPEVNAISSKPKLKIKTLPEAPKAKYKHDRES